MKQFLQRSWQGAVIGTLVVGLSGCGTLFHPERKGQLSGDVDPVVAIANGVGLLFFILPGVIAYAVDFSNGTIYLPSHTSASIDTFKLDDSHDVATLEKLLSDKAGQPVDLHDELMIMEPVESLDEALAMVRMSGVLDDERLGLL
ncbi:MULTISPECIES: hypothetical protein [unclassified Halomonas]|uniref:hypothetical protein n=1 Tax=unclassified Halomonas TaxID=2609666 RepID=UPI0020A14061|nr:MULTISPECIES: hypothetical protein [unclassified Halomonas]MCP1315025.1 hypothetical protein [Halomonas sp. 707D7]MCP1325602.1 hypothetical protein [Halomonas sp. 707D4]